MCDESMMQAILTQHEVNRRILERGGPGHGSGEVLNPSGRYRAEDFEIYALKRRQFHDTARQHLDLNRSVAGGDRLKLDIDGDAALRFDFLGRVERATQGEQFERGAGYVLRKRTLRPIFGELEDAVETPKTLEPWFRRFAVMGKFVRAARRLIVRNRLLRRLQLLQRLTAEAAEEFEEQGFHVHNASYAHLFRKFLLPK